MNEWDVIDEQIEKSKIKRFQWKSMLGMSLTEYIHRLKNKGHTTKETIKIINSHPNILKEMDTFPDDANKMLKNIEISVAARYGESKTAEELKRLKGGQ